MRPTVLKISLERLCENAKVIREALPGRVRMMCVVKANAYGHGAANYALALEKSGVDAFAVAIVEEARELRKAGVRGMILILGGACESSLREAVREDVSQSVYTTEMLDILEDEARATGKTAKAHLKIDSGMSRTGVRGEADLKALLEHWEQCPHVLMEGMFTHFCVADEDECYTAEQNAAFAEALATVRAAGHSPIAHAAATSAMLDERYQYDMVRPGIGLYGSLVPQLQSKLKNAQTLSTYPIREQWIREGETVGYGRTFTAKRDTRVMTLPIGYGDGYQRLLSNRADVLICGKRAPIIGRVCMDMLMIDVTDIPEADLNSEAVLMGEQGNECISPDELAALANTIPYEIMLGFSARIPTVIE